MDPKVKTLLARQDWHSERKALRAIALDCGLTETIKWGKLCYTHNGANLAMFYGLKKYCGLGFFKGALMQDPDGILYSQGEHSQAVRLIRFTSLAEITRTEPQIKACIQDAIRVENAGLKIDFKEKHDLAFPDELLAEFRENPAFKAAFTALTPGRQRGYTLYFSAAKQTQTRAARIEKYRPKILAGKGMNDR